MTFRDYLIVMSVATAAAWIGWIVVIVSIDPTTSGFFGFIFFYASLGIALIGTLSIVGAGMRVWARRADLVSRHVSRAFRQSILFTALVVSSLLLLSNGLFRWWTIGLLMLTIACIELAFTGSGGKKRS